MRLLSLITAFLILACNQPTEKVEHNNSIKVDSTITLVDTSQLEKKIDPNQSFIDFYKIFISNFTKKEIKQHINPTHGLYVIHSNGALPEIKKTYKDSEILELANARLNSNNNIEELVLTPIFEELPQIICDKNPYNKIGCYANYANPLLKNNIWNYSNLNEKEKQAIQFAAETVEITVVNTFFFTFYFSKINGEFKLSFIDIRTPCNA